MATTLATIKTEALETAGLASDDPRFPTATLDRIVNRALRSMAAIHDWPWLQDSETIATVADTVAYTPTDTAWYKTSRLRYDNRDLFRYQPRDAVRYQEITGSPRGYYVEEDQIHIVPTPDGVYSIEHVFYEYENPLGSSAGGTDDTDTPKLPDRYIDWLVWECAKIIATRIRDADLFGMAERQSKVWQRRAQDEVLRTKASIKVQTRSDWSV